jgi:methionyl-tRNA formyltransferase
MNKPNILFAGTPDFALVSLKALVNSGVRPRMVLTQPDRPAGRGKKLTASAVKEFAVASDIPVWQPQTLKDPRVIAELKAVEPDLLIVAAYGLLLPQAVLDIPRCGCLNVHASLLPRWRGAAPIQAAILNGDAATGISLMQMDAGLDTGAVFARETLAIGDAETAGELHDRLALLGGEMLIGQLTSILAGTLSPVPQNAAEATYASKIRTAEARMDWTRPAHDLQRLVRAYNPVPGARFDYGDEMVKCWGAEIAGDEGGSPGKILSADKRGIVVACGEGSLRLTELQRPGRRRVSAAEFSAQLKNASSFSG